MDPGNHLASSVDAAKIAALLLCLVAACSPRTDSAAVKSDTVGTARRAVVGRAVVVSAVVDSEVTIEPGAAATGPSYEAHLAALVLPDGGAAAAVNLAPSDSTDMTNYQAQGWWLGRDDTSPRRRWRFSAGFERFTSGVVALRLDTLLVRDQQEPPFNTTHADSVAVGGLHPVERLATTCRVVGHRPDDRIIGVVRDSTPERWTTPRLAWFVDTAQSRFRRVKPDSLACWLAPNPD